MLDKLIALIFGKDAPKYLNVFLLIRKAQSHGLVGSGISDYVYTRLPAKWRDPIGPATHQEFDEAVQAGAVFAEKLVPLWTK